MSFKNSKKVGAASITIKGCDQHAGTITIFLRRKPPGFYVREDECTFLLVQKKRRFYSATIYCKPGPTEPAAANRSSGNVGRKSCMALVISERLCWTSRMSGIRAFSDTRQL